MLGLLLPSDIVALKESNPQPWSVFMIKDTREVDGRTFISFKISTHDVVDLCRILLALSLSHLTESVPELPVMDIDDKIVSKRIII